MNYKNSALAEIESLANEFEDYTLGKVLLAIMRRKPEGVTTSEWLFNITDEDLYTEVEKTKAIEKEVGFFTTLEIENLKD